MLATIESATLLGTRGLAVKVEVHVGVGLPGFTVVGLPDEACRESRDRVRAALLSSGLSWPQRRITVNLAPSDVRKGGSGLDLPIAVGVLVASGALPAACVERHRFIGELGLDGSVRRVPGIVPLVAELADGEVVVPSGCGREAALVARSGVRPVDTLRALVAALRGEGEWPEEPARESAVTAAPEPDLADVRGHAVARFALEISAAGGHHLLMLGPPGSGKSMLARRLPGLLPPLTPAEALEATMIHSAAGVALPPDGLVRRPPLRAPHHSATMVALIGGGSHWLRPGEISLATNGVLFLDELGEFGTHVLDALRQPVEDGVVHVTRARASASFPARFLLIAAMNPCACGAAGSPGACSCGDVARQRYVRRVSGPLLDRFDLRIVVDRPTVHELLGDEPGESTAVVAERVRRARELARERGIPNNASISPDRLDVLAPLDRAASSLLRQLLENHRLTGRGLHRVRRVARTIADLLGSASVAADHIALAASLRTDPAVLQRGAA